MRILVMGSGGLGGYFGGLLAHSGADVTFIARGAHLQALQTQGLTVQSVHGNFTTRVQAHATPAGIAAVECVLFCVKTYDVPAAAALIQPVVTSRTMILTLQNGVDTPYTLQSVFGRGTILAGLTRIGSTRIAPGVIDQPTTDRTIEFGGLDASAQPQIESMRALLAAADIPVVVAADIQKSLWEKLIYISAFSGLSTLTRLAVADLLAHPPTRAVYGTIMRETTDVARAASIRVAADIVERTLHYLDTSGDPGESSMAVDFRHHRQIEVEAIHGAIARHGQRLHVATPVNTALYASLTIMDHYNRLPPGERF